MKPELLVTIEQQNKLINKQNEVICKLLNENAEQEAIINELLASHVD